MGFNSGFKGLTMRQPYLRKRQTIYLLDQTDFYFIEGNSS